MRRSDENKELAYGILSGKVASASRKYDNTLLWLNTRLYRIDWRNYHEIAVPALQALFRSFPRHAVSGPGRQTARIRLAAPCPDAMPTEVDRLFPEPPKEPLGVGPVF